MQTKLKPWTGLAALLAVLFILPTSPVVANPGDAEMPDVSAPESNLLVIDAITGTVLSYEDHHNALTTVRVVGVLPAHEGFNLVDPHGFAVFGNQFSTSAGSVEFWDQALQPGNYTVIGPVQDGDSGVVVEFDAEPYSVGHGIESALMLAPKAPPVNAQLPRLEPPKYGRLPPVAAPRYTLPSPDQPRVPGPPPINAEVCDGGGIACLTGALPCGGSGEPKCDANYVCQIVPSNCNLPAVAPCPDGKVGYTINGAQTTCVAKPVPPCDAPGKPSCQDLVCQQVPGGDCDPDLPCNDTGKPSCQDYVCARVGGCQTPCDGVSGVYGTKDCVGYACQTVPCIGVGVPIGLPCDAVGTGCADLACSTAGADCDTALRCTSENYDCTTLVTDNTPRLNTNSDHETGQQCGEATQVWSQLVTTRMAWTPTAIIHSPYGGEATVTSDWANTVSVFVAGNGKESKHSLGFKIGSQDGKTQGELKLFRWGYYQEYYYACDVYKGASYAKIVDETPNGQMEVITRFLYGASQFSDADDTESVSASSSVDGNTYGSLTLHHRYRKQEGIVDSRGGGPSQLLVSSQTFESIGAEISFSGGSGSISVGLTAEFKAAKSRSSYYEYTIPANRLIAIDFLGKGQKGGAAFCSKDFTSC